MLSLQETMFLLILTGVLIKKLKIIDAAGRKCEHAFPYKTFRVEDYFEHIFLSYEMKMAKPDEEIFRKVLDLSLIHISLMRVLSVMICCCSMAISLVLHYHSFVIPLPCPFLSPQPCHRYV